jgi:hypothetical protein
MSGAVSVRTYLFRPPEWRSPETLQVQTGALLAAGLVWGALYAWLAQRLLTHGLEGAGSLDLALAVTCVGSGIPLVLGWRRAWRLWRARTRPATWPALTLPQMAALSPSDFEQYVAQRIFARQGYGVINTPDVKDGGVDIIVTDVNGRIAVVQCKRYAGTVGEGVVRDLYGTMIHHDALMAFLVTTGTFSLAARRWVMGKPISLIDGVRLVELAHSEPGPS